MSNIVQVKELLKTYADKVAVDRISFDIPKGIIFGLLGPNGAGKTTTIEMLEGIKAPDGGTILYKDQPIGAQFRSEAGIMFQKTTLQDYITVREALNLFRKLYPKRADLDELIEACALSDFLDQNVHKLSGGQLQRVLLAIALVNDPEIVFLDEPTTGLDPQARRNFWDLVEKVKRGGKTVLLTTHYMDEAKTLCDHLLFLDHGKIIAAGTPNELLEERFSDTIIQLPAGTVDQNVLERTVDFQLQNDRIEIRTASVNETLSSLIAAGVDLQHLQVRARNLDDLFLDLTGSELRA